MSEQVADLVSRLRKLLDGASPRPWQWAGYIAPHEASLPEIKAHDFYKGTVIVLGFTEQEFVHVAHAGTWDPAHEITPSEEAQKEIRRMSVRGLPPTLPINAQGEVDRNGDYVVYVERETVMGFRHKGTITPIGGEGVPPRWACFGGLTQEEAGKEPYRYEINGIAHPDAELLVAAVNALPALLDALEGK